MEQWNSHPVTSACNYTLTQLWVQGIVTSGSTSYSAVIDILTGTKDTQYFGVEEERPVPQEQCVNNVELPKIPYQLSA